MDDKTLRREFVNSLSIAQMQYVNAEGEAAIEREADKLVKLIKQDREANYGKGYDFGALMAMRYAVHLGRKTSHIRQAAKNMEYACLITYPEGESDWQRVLHDTDNHKAWNKQLTTNSEVKQ
jgi:alpha/beta superfamily hydrolase